MMPSMFRNIILIFLFMLFFLVLLIIATSLLFEGIGMNGFFTNPINPFIIVSSFLYSALATLTCLFMILMAERREKAKKRLEELS